MFLMNFCSGAGKVPLQQKNLFYQNQAKQRKTSWNLFAVVLTFCIIKIPGIPV